MLGVALSSPNKLIAFFVVVAMIKDILKLFLHRISIKIHFKMHQVAPFLQKMPWERDQINTNPRTNNPLS